ncbi:Enamine deaminase RidA, house cleaning of reactive enamine intermediates, YjgF/YER057c/UK114 family [Daejeonella rubra]|uniref:Enamine deaminase RidA, house cleaning of reactive enamine intermediates, YjgF/YER057c/UK114 family n=1 Tax=Daejeonella rubra TaxID=990371 RepID=A0A1G9SU72_9SPHI|nr:RidA family protein [Daejeonella rubra]SDM38897.1 Enamine deaminase RidA, house cleaning of reactive enamine intermediates, YjgF/YER057c/UK114 family [Daejeonella rubra]
MKKYFFLSLMAVTLLSCNSAPKEQKAGVVDFDKRLKELNIVLTAPSAPLASYVKTVRVGNLIFTAGHGPDKPDGSRITGRVGEDLTLEQGQEAARLTGIALLSSLKAEIGDLNKVKRIVKVLGMVQSSPDFKDQPKVMNAFSDLMVQVFGDKGKHTRSAVGVNAIPANWATEIEMVVEVED